MRKQEQEQEALQTRKQGTGQRIKDKSREG
jgi:hypothetical protein